VRELKVNSELQTLLPSLSDEEYKGLEADILEHGCLSPIVVWNDVIVDGHNRYAICRDHEISFDAIELEFESLDDAKLWAWSHQEHRRNLTPFQRTEIAKRFKSMLAAKAMQNKTASGGDRKSEQAKSVLTTLTKPVSEETKPMNVRAELAKIAGVSEGTMAKAEYLHEHADEETKQRLRGNETTIHREYNRLKQEESDEEQLLSVPRESGEYQGCVTLRHILLRDTDSLVSCLFSIFDASYRERLILDVLRKALVDDGPVAVEKIVHTIHREFPIHSNSTER
jgi:ParB-like chromosome segregation protein Spo0J